MRRQIINVKRSLTIFFLFISFFGTAQTDAAKLVTAMKEFHQALVNKNLVSIVQHTDKALSYGHSNGWIETKDDMLTNLQTGYITYHSIKEDSVKAVINGSLAHARFVGDYKVTMNGNTNTFHLRVLEVWVKKGKRWLLFARQAVK